MSTNDVIIVNPLGGALQHYTRALADALDHTGARVSVSHVNEPSITGRSSLDWARRYITALWSARRTARRSDARVIVTWPVLGHLDRLIMHTVLGRRIESALVMHDPRPLVHARGYSTLSRRTGALACAVQLIVHSTTAHTALTTDSPETTPELLPHPVFPRTATPQPEPASEQPVVRVLGQFKPDRDLTLLAEIGERLDTRYRLEIIGRGWPSIAGWTVTDEFVPEEHLDTLIATAQAVLVPYKRFFQSGIAIRSLELGTPAIGPTGSSIADLYPDNRYLANDTATSWCDAISAATSADRDHTRTLAAHAAHTSRTAWSRWLTTPINRGT
ncbi:glycosyltransferase [Curtobacterium sp. MCLR17_054]|uniref:glycosyltransferase n=1 Tax=Curtobacterium sp. MCLR17_054 TaxID=2175632 RepID=UPI000DAA5887|nr:glycosyltransferase [Curtobacterium sp. MCLR17_054]WIE70226.1 glycosyltransferase [Curtobacterium sp. MCLR17_054]